MPQPTALIKPASWAYAESFVAEDDILAAARSRAEEVGVAPVGSGAVSYTHLTLPTTPYV